MQFKFSFLAFRYWPTWIGLAILRAIVFLPQRARMRAGAWLGKLMYKTGKKRRGYAECNLRACFPNQTDDWIENTIYQHFEALGKGIIEMGMCWWLPEKTLVDLTKVHGIENLQNALGYGKGIILLGAHFTSIELGVRLLKPYTDALIVPVYQINQDEFTEYVITGSRLRHATQVIDREDVREMVRALRKNKILWYAPDQAYNGKLSALVPFFGVPAATNTATPRLTKLSGAKVVPYIIRRRADDSGYDTWLFPAFDDYPSDDPVADTGRYHALIEQEILKAPEQYYWVHRRFKDRPAEYPYLYND